LAANIVAAGATLQGMPASAGIFSQIRNYRPLSDEQDVRNPATYAHADLDDHHGQGHADP